MTTRLKVQGGLIVMAVVFAVIAGISIVSFFSLSRNTDELQSGLGQQSFYLMRTIDHLEWDKKLTDHIYQGGTAKVETDPHKCKLGEWFYPYLNSDEFRALPEKTRSRLLELKEPHRQLHESAADVMAHMMKGDTNGAAALYKSRVEPNLLQVRGIINGLNRDLEGMAESRKASIVAVLSSSKTAIIVSMVIGAGVLLFVFFITFNAMGIMDKLKPFKEQFSKSAMGDLTSHYALKSVNCSAIMGCGNKECPDFGRDGVLCWFDVGSYAPEFGKEIHCPKILTKEYKSCLECRVYRMVNIDEVATLAAWYNKFMDNLEETVSNVIVASQNLAQAVEQISSGNQNLSQRTSEQASSLEEIASTIEEATATINQNAENAQMANRNSEDSFRLAEEGGEVVVQAVASINEINDSSKKIGEIIAVINEIAFQTNLLALNAAVEAARAGEQGRGFAVVAGEVRNLAQRASSASKEIESLIKDSVVKVDRGTKLAEKSGEALQEIIKSIRQVSQVVSEIAAASEEQKQGVGQINTAITEMDTMTQQNASLVEETASASEEMANQAQDLLAMMEKFKIKDQRKEDVYRQKHREVHLQAAEMGKGNGNGGKRQTVPPAHVIAGGDGDHVKKMLREEGFEEF